MTAGAQRAAELLEPLIEAELGRFGLPGEALALAGFSQGAMMAMQIGLRRRPPPAAILAYSGVLLGAESLAAALAGKPPVLLVHGEVDDIVPVGASRAAEAALRAAGVPVEAIYRPGLPHAIDSVGIEAGARTLSRAFAP
jgi:phospholipase/carboxylesterase